MPELKFLVRGNVKIQHYFYFEAHAELIVLQIVRMIKINV